jgi:hypothetical protein
MAMFSTESSLTLLVCSALAGCASPTATIAREAVNVREAAAAAERHMDAARAELDRISASANQVSMATAYVSDDESPVLLAMKYGTYIAGALAIGAVAYTIKTRT